MREFNIFLWILLLFLNAFLLIEAKKNGTATTKATSNVPNQAKHMEAKVRSEIKKQEPQLRGSNIQKPDGKNQNHGSQINKQGSKIQNSGSMMHKSGKNQNHGSQIQKHDSNGKPCPPGRKNCKQNELNKNQRRKKLQANKEHEMNARRQKNGEMSSKNPRLKSTTAKNPKIVGNKKVVTPPKKKTVNGKSPVKTAMNAANNSTLIDDDDSIVEDHSTSIVDSNSTSIVGDLSSNSGIDVDDDEVEQMSSNQETSSKTSGISISIATTESTSIVDSVANGNQESSSKKSGTSTSIASTKLTSTSKVNSVTTSTMQKASMQTTQATTVSSNPVGGMFGSMLSQFNLPSMGSLPSMESMGSMGSMLLPKTTTAATTTTIPCAAKCQVCSGAPISSIFDANGVIKKTTIESNYDVMESCGSTFIIGRYKATQEEAHKKCCELGMRLITIQNADKVQCFVTAILDAIRDLSPRYLSTFWTSGFDTQCSNSRTFTWCGTGEAFNQTFWNAGAPEKTISSTKSCVTYDASKLASIEVILSKKAPNGGMSDDACSNYNFYSCEINKQETGVVVTTQAPVVIDYSKYQCKVECPTCTGIPATPIFNENGIIKTREELDYDSVMSSCNQTYLIGRVKTTQMEAHKKCCARGMRLVTLENNDKVQCFVTAIIGVLGRLSPAYLDNFWTSGTDFGCHKVTDARLFKWCGIDKNFQTSYWNAGQPGAPPTSNYCVTYDASKLASASVVLSRLAPKGGMADGDCNALNYYACEMDTPAGSKLVSNTGMAITAPPAAEQDNTKYQCTVSCPAACSGASTSIFKANGALKTSSELNTDPTDVVQAIAACNVTYLAGKTMVTQKQARQKCCERGMKVLTLDSPEKRKCFADALLVIYLKSSTSFLADYWTSATDYGCHQTADARVFKWCQSDKYLVGDKVLWNFGSPGKGPSTKNCAMHYNVARMTSTGIDVNSLLSTNRIEATVGITDEDCNKLHYYMCEIATPIVSR